MPDFTEKFSRAFRDFVNDGVASSGAHEVDKAEVREIGPDLDEKFNYVLDNQSGGYIGFTSKEAMDADLAHPEGTLAKVGGDTEEENNGTYRKTGASGSGSWELFDDPITQIRSGAEAAAAAAQQSAVEAQAVVDEADSRYSAMLDAQGFDRNGLMGLWFFSQFKANPRRYVRNALSSAPVSLNLYEAPRRLFSNAQLWNKANVTVTDDYDSAPAGWEESSRLVGTTGWRINSWTRNMPAGTYTFAADLKSNGSSLDVLVYVGLVGDTYSATSTGGRVSITGYHPGGDLIFGIEDVVGGSCDLLIRDFELFAGAADKHRLLSSHIYFTPEAVLEDGFVRQDAARSYGVMQLPSELTVSTFTLQAVVKGISPQGYYPIVSKVQDFNEFVFGLIDEDGAVPKEIPVNIKLHRFNSNADAGFNTLYHGVLRLIDDGEPHILTLRNSGTRQEMFVDDVLLYSYDNDFLSEQVRDLYVGLLASDPVVNGLGIGGLAWWSRALSDEEVRDHLGVWQELALQHGVDLNSLSATRNILVAEGDSITAGWSYTYAYKYFRQTDPIIFGNVMAVSGSDLPYLGYRANAVDAILPPDLTGRKFVLTVHIGVNDIGRLSGSAAARAASILSDYADYCDARRSAGWKVVVCTLLHSDQSDDSLGDDCRAIINAALVNDWAGVHCDAVVDFASDAIMGTDTSYIDNPSYWLDETHPSEAGHERLFDLYKPVVDALFE